MRNRHHTLCFEACLPSIFFAHTPLQDDLPACSDGQRGEEGRRRMTWRRTYLCLAREREKATGNHSCSPCACTAQWVQFTCLPPPTIDATRFPLSIPTPPGPACASCHLMGLTVPFLGSLPQFPSPTPFPYLSACCLPAPFPYPTTPAPNLPHPTYLYPHSSHPLPACLPSPLEERT